MRFISYSYQNIPKSTFPKQNPVNTSSQLSLSDPDSPDTDLQFLKQKTKNETMENIFSALNFFEEEKKEEQ